MENKASSFAFGIGGIALVSYSLFLKSILDADYAGMVVWGFASAGTCAMMLGHDTEFNLGNLRQNFLFTLSYVAGVAALLPLTLWFTHVASFGFDAFGLTARAVGAVADIGLVVGVVAAVLGFSVFAAIGELDEVFPASA